MEQQTSITDSYPQTIDNSNSAPALSIIFYFIGGLLFIGGALGAIAFINDGSNNASEVGIAFGSALFGLLLIALAFGLHKLSQIERHLRSISEVESWMKKKSLKAA